MSNPGPASTVSVGLQNVSYNQGIVLLGSAKGVNLNDVSDNIIQVIGSDKYSVLYCMVGNASTSLTTADAGLYTGPGATGLTVVTAAALSAITANADVLQMTIASTDMLTAPNLYFRCTTAQGAAATADVWIYGFNMDL